jgi:hypothetical protein
MYVLRMLEIIIYPGLQVWVYEEADEVGGPSNLYVHHDILLHAFPLSVAWTDCSPIGRVEAGNFAAVGTMSPGVEIWDLDVTDSVEPIASLGGELPGSKEPKEFSQEGKKGKTKSRRKVLHGSSASAPLYCHNAVSDKTPCTHVGKTLRFRCGCPATICFCMQNLS